MSIHLTSESWSNSFSTPPPLLPDDWWMDACARWPADERLLVVFIGSVLHALALYISCGVFVLAERKNFWSAYRLPRQRPDLKADTPENVQLNRRAFYEQLLGTFFVVPLFLYLAYPIIASSITVCDPLPRARIWCRDIALMIVGCDTIFYWTHRALHASPLLYRTIHKQHHGFKATTIWASEYFGIVDLILNVLPGIIPSMVLGSHFAVLMLFTVLRQWQTVQSHSGFDLPFDPFNRGLFHGGSRRHDFHHSHNHGCYSDFLPFWDWLCGTDHAYKAFWTKNAKLAAY